MKKIFLTSSALTLLLLGACSGGDNAKKELKEESAPVVKTMQVNDREVNQIGKYTATVEPELINNISASSPNRIKQIFVDEGMRVSAGQKPPRVLPTSSRQTVPRHKFRLSGFA